MTEPIYDLARDNAALAHAVAQNEAQSARMRIEQAKVRCSLTQEEVRRLSELCREIVDAALLHVSYLGITVKVRGAAKPYVLEPKHLVFDHPDARHRE